MVHQTIIPEEYVGKEVEIVAFVKHQETENTSIALPGKPLSKKAFADWIEQVEQMPSVTLEEAKIKWEAKRARLLQSSR